jgi:DnaJ-class molecular chaperone
MEREVDEIAEAGEEFIIGPYEQCIHCQGAGVHIHVDKKREHCPHCHGAGRRMRDEWAKACITLGYRDELNRIVQVLTLASRQTRKSVQQSNQMLRLKEANDKATAEKARLQKQLDDQWAELAATGRIKNKRL